MVNPDKLKDIIENEYLRKLVFVPLVFLYIFLIGIVYL